jgi:NADPH:quinone reductase-like Zn-dependent oxidoreductase
MIAQEWSRTMKAIVISKPGGPEVLTITELPDPVPASDEVLIRVRAFGLNHAEAYMRAGAWGKVADVTGIEAAGTVEGGALPVGTTVVAILGGMGRTRNGSYAELVTVPVSNVVPVVSALPWTDLAAVPEVYATAWSGLCGNSVLRDSLALVRQRGRVCQLGFLGGFDPVADFDPIADLPSGVQLSFYGSAFVLGTPEFPLGDVPMADIFDKVATGRYQARPVRVFDFDEIVTAHQVMESGEALGKMVVTVD